jgi:hypothetical protein
MARAEASSMLRLPFSKRDSGVGVLTPAMAARRRCVSFWALRLS